MSRGKRRTARGSSGTPVLLILGLVGGGLFLVAVLGVVVYVGLGRLGLVAPAVVLDPPNPRVTPQNYQAVKNGHRLAEVEAILGQGRVLTSRDFDAICGTEDEDRFIKHYYHERPNWEEFNGKGHIRIWTNGQVRILAFFHLPAERGGRLVRKILLHADGSALSEGGMHFDVDSPFAPPAPPSNPNTRPGQPSPPAEGHPYTVAELLAEFNRDRAAATAKFGNRRVTVTGTLDHVVVGHVTMNAPDGKGKVQARLDGVATGAISRKKVGDPITVTGRMVGYFPTTNMVMLESCRFE